MPFDAWTAEREEAGKARNSGTRWDTENRARVVTDDGVTVIVPHISNYSAILCTGEILGKEPGELMDAAVWAAEAGARIGIVRE